MELQIPCGVCAKVSKEGILQRKKRGYQRHNKDSMPMEGCRNNRGRGMPGPHTPFTKYPAQNERFGFYGIPKRKEQSYDISKVWEYEIRIPKPRILV